MQVSNVTSRWRCAHIAIIVTACKTYMILAAQFYLENENRVTVKYQLCGFGKQDTKIQKILS